MRRPISIVFVIWLALGTWSCGGGNSSVTGDGASGIQGVVLAGPQCPVERAGSPCPDIPFPGTVRATDTGGGSAQVQTDGQGRFRLALEPGIYIVTLTLPNAGPPTAKPVSVTVDQSEFKQITLQVDTGIR